MTDALPQAEPSSGTVTGGSLAGLRVIDLTRVLGGPYCTMILSDHGADVVKIEPPQGDETRAWGPPFHEGDASYYLGVNRNKKSIALDLSKPAGRDVLLRLLDGADVLVENYKPGSMEKWGIGFDALSVRFPRLIHCRVSGFGGEGPLGGMPGYDAVIQAMVGLMSINGTPDTGPVRMATPLVDLATGLYSAVAILMALHERERSGLGQYLDMTLHDCGMSLLHSHAPNYFLNGKRPAATGNPHPNLGPYSKFRTRTCEVFIACGNDPAWRKLCAFLDLKDAAADPRFSTNAGRMTHRAEIERILDARLAEEDGHDLTTRMLKAGLPAGPVLHVDEAVESPHAAARNMVAEIGWFRALNTPIKMSRTPGGARTLPPTFNQHGTEVLAAAGYSEDEIAALRESGVLVETPR